MLWTCSEHALTATGEYIGPSLGWVAGLMKRLGQVSGLVSWHDDTGYWTSYLQSSTYHLLLYLPSATGVDRLVEIVETTISFPYPGNVS
jgi:hypothetical protein